MIKTLCVGAVGGALFALLGLPLPWLLGSLLATMGASLSGVQLNVPTKMRQLIIILIGLMVGSTFSPDILSHLGEWAVSLAFVLLYTALLSIAAYGYGRFILNLPPISATLSALPGGLSELTVLADDVGADTRAIALVHAARVVCVIFTIPVFLTYGYDLGKYASDSLPQLWTLKEGAILLIGAVIGIYGAKICRLPSARMMGPLLVSAGLHVSGTISAEPPELLTSAVQLVLGSGLGARYSGVSLRTLARLLALSFVLSFGIILLTFGIAYGLHLWLGFGFGALLLAFAPGGFAEMSLAALSLGVDPAFVTTHHAVRLFAIILLGPFIIRAIIKRTTAKN